MSQVITKLQSGGSLTIDGIKYKATPEFINALTTHLRETAGTDAQTLAGLSNALLNGENLKYDSAANTISGMDGSWSGITNRQNELRRAGSSRWRKWWEAQFDTDAHRFRNALSAIGSFHYQVPKETEETPTNLKDIYGDTAWFDYIDKDGTKVWSENSAKNAGLMQRLDDMTAYLSDPEAGKKIYKLSSQYTPEHMSALQGLYNQSKDRWADTLNQIKTRARNNQLEEDDIKFLNNFFIAKPDAAAEETEEAKEAANKKKWTDAGFGGLYDRLNGIAYIDDNDGTITLNPGASWGWNLGDLDGRNIYFNDDFYNSDYAVDGSFDPFRGYTLYNNKLYALNNPNLPRILKHFNELKDAGDWEAADNIIMTRFTDAARENPGVFRKDRYSQFLSDHPEYRFRNLTGLYDIAGLNDGEQLIQLYNLDKPVDNPNSPYREYTPQYMVLDDHGKLVRDYGNFNGKRIRGASAKDLNAYKRVTSEMGGNPKYHGRYYEDFVDKDNRPTGYRIYYNPQDPNEDVILHMPIINAAGIEENQDINLPSNLGRIIAKKFQDEDFLKRLIGNKQNKQDFQTFISALVQSWYRQLDNTDWGRAAWTLPWVESNRKRLKDLGFKNEELEEVIKAWRDAKRNRTSGNREERRNKYLVTAPEIPEEEKNGGVLKNQFGGVAGGSTEVRANTSRKIDTKNKNTQNASGALELKDWTAADKADIFALIADLGSLGLAIAPGMGIAAAGTGAAGSTARLYSDLSRGTKGAGLNYLLNLGMDAATIIPGLGAGIKGVNIAKTVGKALPTIIKAASVYGLGAGVVDTAKKIASGQKFTVRDVDMLVNALTAGVGLGKSGGFGKKTKKVAGFVGEEPTIKFKAGENGVKPEGVVETFKLDRTKLSDVDTPEAFKKAVVNAAKKAGDTSVTLENVSDRYDLSAFISNNGKSWAPSWNPKTWFKANKKGIEKLNDKSLNMKTKNKPVDFTPEEIAKMSDFEKWWRGLTDANVAYKRALTREPVNNRNFLIKTKGGQKSQKQVWDGESWKEVKRTEKSFDTDQLALTSVPIVPGSNNPNNLLPVPISSIRHQVMPTPLRGLRTTITSEPLTNTVKITRGKGVKFDRKAYEEFVNLLKRQSIALPQWINPFTAANYQENEDFQPSGFIMPNLYKEGGKIEKGQTGLRLNGPILNPDLSSGFKFKTDPLYTVPTGSTTTFTPSTPTTLSSSTTNFRVINPMTGQPVQTTSSVGTEQGSKSEGVQNPYNHGGFSLEAGIDPTMPLNTISAVVQLGNAKRQRDIGLRGGPLQYEYTWIPNPRFINTGEGDAFRNQAKQIVTKDKSSDNLQNALLARIDDQQRRELAIQGDLADSKVFSAYKSQIDQNYANNISRADQMANQNKYLFDNWKQRQKNTELGYETMKSQVLDKLLYAGTQYASDNYRNYRNMLAQKDLAKEIETNGNEYLSKIKGLDLSTEGGARAAAGFRDTLTLQNQIANLKAQGKAELSNYYYNKLFAKSGGKVSSEGKRSAVTYSKDPYPELLLQNAKDSTEIVKQLNDAVIKLLLQTKPINVH